MYMHKPISVFLGILAMPRRESQPIRLKTVTWGNGGVGKTCMYIRYATGQYPEEYVPTVFDNYAVNVELDGQAVELALWDTGGGEDYWRLRPLSYPDTDVFLLLFDVTTMHVDFEGIYSYWWKELNHHCPHVPIILVGSKIDLRFNGVRTITTVEGEAMAEKICAAKYMEISSLRNRGVAELFQEAISIGHNYRTVTKKKKKKKCSIL